MTGEDERPTTGVSRCDLSSLPPSPDSLPLSPWLALASYFHGAKPATFTLKSQLTRTYTLLPLTIAPSLPSRPTAFLTTLLMHASCRYLIFSYLKLLTLGGKDGDRFAMGGGGGQEVEGWRRECV